MSDGNLTRFEFDGRVEHRNGQQFVGGQGFAGDLFTQVHRVEPHGFVSHPVKGGKGLLFQSRGNRDAAYVLGGENPAMRPSLDMGGSAIYDHMGNIMSVVGAKLRLAHSTLVEIECSNVILTGDFTIDGNVTVNGNINATGSITDGDGDGGA